jgi:serine-type D-Ala-D-Ala carboxypeptidase/endopeptidase (penicillin-binding protein 4)
MKLSNNAHAETFIKELGVVKTGEGNWAKGLDVLIEELKQWNINTETLVLRDGSGISHVSGVPANQITQLLYEIQAESWFPTFLESLPLVGGSNRLDRGTLYSRMSHTKASGQVRAKTGTLTTVSSLAGYIHTPQEENLIFSMILCCCWVIKGPRIGICLSNL